MTTSGRLGALAGIAAAALAIGAAELVAVATGSRSAPLVAVGGVVVDSVPAPVKQFAVDVFGVHDKTALIVGTAVLLAAFAAAVGALAVRNPVLGLAGIGLFGAIGVAAALTRPGTGPAAALPSLVGAALAAGVLWLFIAGPMELSPPARRRSADAAGGRPGPRHARDTGAGPRRGTGVGGTGTGAGRWVTAGGDPGTPEVPPGLAPEAPPGLAAEAPPGLAAEAPPGLAAEAPPGLPADVRPDRLDLDWSEQRELEEWRAGRRRFLTGIATVLGVAAAAGLGGRWLSTRRGVAAARSAIALPTPSSPAVPVPGGADLRLPHLASYVTPNPVFYRIDTALAVPQVDPATWRLRIHGRVRQPITLSYADLLARPMIERYITLACVSNEVGGDLIGNARWLGVRLADLLDEAGPLDGADQVVGRSTDGWTCGTPTAVLRDGRDAMLAVGMNGEPLPVEHGFPVRVVVPGLYGYVSACKWVVELELTSFADFDAYWVPRGWAAQGPIKTESRIDTPRQGAQRPAGPVTVAGVAWAQHRGIRRVEVRVDGGPWQQATLAAAVSIDTWVQWSWQWDATPGEHTLSVRATDATGAVQPEERRPPAPDGATGWHTVRVTVA